LITIKDEEHKEEEELLQFQNLPNITLTEYSANPPFGLWLYKIDSQVLDKLENLFEI